MNKNFKDKSSDALKYFVNEKIRADRMMVIDHLGQSLGVLSKPQALMRASEVSLDLVQVGEKDGMPIAKLMDFGKFLYAKKKQLNEAKKHQKVIVIKEVKMRPNIGEQDYKTKMNQAEHFFLDGNKVKFTLQFRGREAAMMNEVGPKFFAKIVQDLSTHDIGGALVEEKDNRAGSLWTKIFYVKGK